MSGAGKAALAVLAVAAAMFVALAGQGDGPPYLSNSRGDMGASVLYDTLSHMGFNVGRSFAPITERTAPGDAYIVISPAGEPGETLDAMLAWVYAGGRLVYLANDGALQGRLGAGDEALPGFFTLYRHGAGELLTGFPLPVLNGTLAKDGSGARPLYLTLRGWDPQRVRFGEGYHTARAERTLVGSLPLAAQLFLVQAGIACALALWHFGKRFGAVVPFYSNTERKENEYLRSLAWLLHLAGKNERGKT